ncbi:ABC transporter ATP-binding protein [Dyadobacter frigoris]|nr:ATP-binding cassette domain-containing protein [Dyadobacter frigoris]GLU51089.1 bacitracin ABC transporter ATP-binding protein [Dyadobacter frigoris]
MQNTEELIIETSHVSFGFSKGQNALNDVNLQIPKGAIYGFLGPNGAGKTTTIRILLNLLKPSNGYVNLFGKRVTGTSNNLFSRIGSLIETPSLYEHLTGLDNLLITANIRNIPKSRVTEVLEIVGLSSYGGMHVKKYSLGMKQRLGLAIALLPSPDLLILDEPTNGLDPTGIIEIRELLLLLCKERGVTILISSHLLAEIEKLVSHVGILNQGKMLFQGSFKNLQQIREEKSIIEIDTDQNDRAINLLLENNHPVSQGKEFLEVKFLNICQLSAITSLLVIAGLAIYRMQLIESSLEQTFLSIINKTGQP